jgi:hypothetical protein
MTTFARLVGEAALLSLAQQGVVVVQLIQMFQPE